MLLQQSFTSFTVETNHSQPASYNGHLSTVATYFFSGDGLYIHSYFHLSILATATIACPKLPKYPLHNNQLIN